MKTVYFLGAGASHGSDFNLPVMRGFFREEDFCGGHYSNLGAYMENAFPATQLNELNLEEVITHLDLSLEGVGALWERPGAQLWQTRYELDDYIATRLSVDGSEDRICPVHKALLGSVLDQDTIVTLNYDLIGEHALHRMFQDSKGQGDWLSSKLGMLHNILGRTLVYGGELPSLHHSHCGRGYYLKLHGSLNWVYCPTAPCGNHQLLFPAWVDAPEVPVQPGLPCNLCGAGLVRVIIPPTIGKSFERFPKMGLVWNLAYRELREADRWILIGLSLPESDSHLRWLLREAARKREKEPEVTVVNPEQAAFEKARQLCGRWKVEWFNGGIREYVAQSEQFAPQGAEPS